MQGFLIVAILSVATGQPLFFKPQQQDKAACCSDGLNCCPSGTTCDVSTGTCNRDNKQTELVMSSVEKLEIVICPGGQYYCPDGYNCCARPFGGYGCCPLATYPVCCPDGYHCCLQGTICDPTSRYCLRGSLKFEAALRSPAFRYENVMCPDDKSECPDSSICCKLPSGEYGCCPLPHAACCSDGLNCCPSGTTCDASTGTCNRDNKQTDLVMSSVAKLEIVLCPGGQYYCPDGYNCCARPFGEYGCCPLATYPVCCSDGYHCCPQGFICDPKSRYCLRGSLKFEAALKSPAFRYENVICPDGKSKCPGSSTCCKLPSGAYGCCPLPHAVCCSDKLHCCPSGETCDLTEGTCKKKLFQDWLVKNLAEQKTKEKAENLNKP